MTTDVTTPPAASNGHALDESDDDVHAVADRALARTVDGLREVLALEHGRVQALEAQLRDVREQLHDAHEREKRVQRAIDVLEGNKAPQGRPKRGPGVNSRAAGSRNVELVLGALLDVGGAIGISELERKTGLAGSTVQRALNVLRDDDRARVAGKDRMAVLYAAMPDASVRDVTTSSGSKPTSSGSKPSHPGLSADAREERERAIVEYGREHGEFRASDVGPLIGLSASSGGLGPTMAALVRRGVIEQTRSELVEGTRTAVAVYRVVSDAA